MKVLCFDIGGTEIKYAVVDESKSLDIFKIPTRKTEVDNYILEDVCKIIENFEKEIDAVAISTGGVVDNKKGIVVFAGPTIPKYTDTRFKEIIEKKYNKPCFVENDVNCAAIGEYYEGKYTGSVFCLTVGTGVGGSIIFDGNVYTGNSMCAGEIGYMPFNGGYFQDYASTTFLVDYVSQRLSKKVNGLYIFEEAKKGDKLCNEAIDLLVDNLTTGLLNIIYILNPKSIIIGGGITAQGKYLEDKIVSKINGKIISKQFKTEISLAKLANSAGIMGAYYFLRKEMKNV